MTQKELAEKIGISFQVLSDLERGVCRVSQETMQKIWDYFAEKEKHEPMESIIDYLRVSFPLRKVDKIFTDILMIKQEFFAEVDVHLYGYIGGYQLDYIQVLYSKKNDDRGVLIQLAGQGCRQFEAFLIAQRRTWFDFFCTCFNYRCHITRIDLAINDYVECLSIPALLNKTLRQELRSRFRKFEFNGSGTIAEKNPGGTTIYFGSKKSEFYIVFYQKDYEQSQKYNIPVEEVPIKNRYELRFKNKRAMLVIEEFLEKRELSSIILGVMTDYLVFTDRKKGVGRKYWKVNRKWQEFINDSEKIRLVIEPDDHLYERSKNWFKRTAAVTAKMIQELDEIKGTKEHEEMLAEVRFSDKQQYILAIQAKEINGMITKAL